MPYLCFGLNSCLVSGSRCYFIHALFRALCLNLCLISGWMDEASSGIHGLIHAELRRKSGGEMKHNSGEYGMNPAGETRQKSTQNTNICTMSANRI